MNNNPSTKKAAYAPLECTVPLATAGVPSISARRCVEVVAPSSLKAGYQFDVEVDGITCTIEVPEGGVEQGQRFAAVVIAEGEAVERNQTMHHNIAVKSPASRMSIPVGHWRDGICDCCTHGCCHPVLCLGFWCKPVLLAQVLTRMNLSWSGEVRHDPSAQRGMSTFKIFVAIFVAFFALQMFLGAIYQGYMMDAQKNAYHSNGFYDNNGSYHYQDGKMPVELPIMAFAILGLKNITAFFFAIFLIVVTMKTRAYIREKYAIPEQTCTGCEDFVCACCCNPCTQCQMARHTADYHLVRSGLCTETGIPADAPQVV